MIANIENSKDCLLASLLKLSLDQIIIVWQRYIYDAPTRSRYTINVKLRKRKKWTVKSCGYFPLKKRAERMWIFLKGKDLFVCLTTGFEKSA